MRSSIRLVSFHCTSPRQSKKVLGNVLPVSVPLKGTVQLFLDFGQLTVGFNLCRT